MDVSMKKVTLRFITLGDGCKAKKTGHNGRGGEKGERSLGRARTGRGGKRERGKLWKRRNTRSRGGEADGARAKVN